MSVKCALFGHKYKAFVDDFKIALAAGPAIKVEMKTCERCGKKFFRIVGNGTLTSSDGKSKVDVSFSFQPKLIGNWDVSQVTE